MCTYFQREGVFLNFTHQMTRIYDKLTDLLHSSITYDCTSALFSSKFAIESIDIN